MQTARTEQPRDEHARDVIEAHHKVADLMRPKPAIYWLDLLASSTIGWASLVQGARTSSLFLGIVATLALYRALLFIHEITHLRRGALPGFRTGWNALIGVPLLVPSFFYVGVHLDHHNPNYYGTKQDPEYHALAPGSVLGVIAFVIFSALVPLALLFRFAVLAPLSHIVPWLRKVLIERCSSLVINVNYIRAWPRNAQEQKEWLVCDSLGTIWALGHILAVARGLYPLHHLLYALGVLSAVAVVNQVRTLVAHRFEHHEEKLTFEEQLLDSINYPGPILFTELWAPLGLRYHALHHYLPGLPYHSMPEAHRRLSTELPADANYHKVSSRSFWESFMKLMEALPGKPPVAPV